MRDTAERFVRWFVLVGFTGCILVSCSKKPGVEGRVVDPWGNALSEVQIRVEGSSFSAVTDEQGFYLVGYAPGNFTVNYTHPGYTSHKSELSISSEMRFPADTVTLYPMPDKPGIFMLDEGQMTALPAVKLQKRERSQSWPPRNFCTIYAPEAAVATFLSVPAGTITFCDTRPETLRLARLSNRYIVQDYSYTFGSTKFTYNQLVDDEKTRVGVEGLTIRTTTLEPGCYAWVTVAKNMTGSLRVQPTAGAYGIVVTENQTASSDSI